MNRLNEIAARLTEIRGMIDTAEGEALDALTAEVEQLEAERTKLLADIERRNQLRSRVAAGIEPAEGESTPAMPEPNAAEARAQAFASTSREVIGCAEARATLISGGTLVTPTNVEGINDIPGAKVSSIIDMCRVVNCEGMGKNMVALITEDMDEASTQTEGEEVDEKKPGFGIVTITPETAATLSFISKQAKKQTPLNYEGKVREQAFTALRKKAATIVTNALKNSEHIATYTATVKSGKGAVDETTLRKLTMNYGGDESILGEAVLFLNKKDLIALGDIRGTNEKRALYEITPDSSNPNTGVIKEGGFSVKYCINSKLTACSGTAQTNKPIRTMFYGNPQNVELDLFSDYSIRVSEDFAINKLLDTIVGDVELGAGVIAKNGFVALTIPATA